MIPSRRALRCVCLLHLARRHLFTALPASHVDSSLQSPVYCVTNTLVNILILSVNSSHYVVCIHPIILYCPFPPPSKNQHSYLCLLNPFHYLDFVDSQWFLCRFLRTILVTVYIIAFDQAMRSRYNLKSTIRPLHLYI